MHLVRTTSDLSLNKAIKYSHNTDNVKHIVTETKTLYCVNTTVEVTSSLPGVCTASVNRMQGVYVVQGIQTG
ncbi:hypothetical protein EB796_021785 [Bugula neritina]|uniref:Uncharacterized protein n=1 Tax=Bugula neritina TaxID=10212 RepID=A0A7J7J1E4_BUGNE|nr:hypothetical protein EB796_021785 [Bugula neritina]